MGDSGKTLTGLSLLRVCSVGHRDRGQVPGKEATQAGDDQGGSGGVTASFNLL